MVLETIKGIKMNMVLGTRGNSTCRLEGDVIRREREGRIRLRSRKPHNKENGEEWRERGGDVL